MIKTETWTETEKSLALYNSFSQIFGTSKENIRNIRL